MIYLAAVHGVKTKKSAGGNMTGFIRKLPLISGQNAIGQFLRSVIAGGIASLVDVSVYSICVNAIGINHIVSNTFSFVFGLLVNYYLSREWVFNQRVHNVKRDFFLFSVIGVIGLLMSNVMLLLLVDAGILYFLLASNNSGLVKTAAKIITVVLVFFWNFLARKKIVFAG